MPVYAYKCRDCGTPLEVHQEFSDAALTECPVCGGVLRKQYGSIGVTFNGSGFYRTDSRAGSGEGKSDGKSDSKGDSSGTRSDGGGGDSAKGASSDSGAKKESKPAASNASASS